MAIGRLEAPHKIVFACLYKRKELLVGALATEVEVRPVFEIDHARTYSMELIVPVPYIQQPDQRTCWNACYKMMLRFQGRPESEADSLPNDAKMRTRGIMDDEFCACRDKLKLTSSIYQGFKTPQQLKEKLERYGPIWASGFWADGHKHIVVIRGIRISWYSSESDISNWQVYVNDPFRKLAGAEAKPSWWSFSRFAYKLNEVPFSCQHWM